MKAIPLRILIVAAITVAAVAGAAFVLSGRRASAPASLGAAPSAPSAAGAPAKFGALPAVPAVGLETYFRNLTAANADIYTVQPGDTLTKISKQFSVTTGLISAANNLKGDAIFPGMKLKIMKDRWNLLIDKSRFKLDLVAAGAVVKTYRIGIGKDGSTPVGDFKIASRLKNPTWYHDGKVLPFGNPDNPLGTRWLGLDAKSYGLHGTIQPDSIGKAESLGCIRMLNADVEELFDLVPVGTPVRIVEAQ